MDNKMEMYEHVRRLYGIPYLDFYKTERNQPKEGPEEKDMSDPAEDEFKKNGHLYLSSFFKPLIEIENVIFNPPATIVFWQDGTKTVVKCGEHDIYDPEKGIAMAIAKRVLGNQGNYYNKIKEWLPVDYSPVSISVDLAKSEDFTGRQEIDKSGYIQENKYGDKYDTRLFFAGKRHKVVCAGDCYHVKNIRKENALVYTSLEAAMMDGCIPCKYCNGKHKEEE